MGTRYMVIVRKGGKDVVRQYGQWDGGQHHAGANICKFLAHVDRDAFKERLDAVQLVPYPHPAAEPTPDWLSRDAGWKVLDYLMQAQGSMTLYDWADDYWLPAVSYLYVLDADDDTYRVFRPGASDTTEQRIYAGLEWREVAATIPDGFF